MSRHCLVLAGGLGTRLLPVTKGLLPKALAPVNGVPFIAYKLQSLADMGVDSVTLLVGELGHLIEDFLWENPHFNLDIQCVYDGEILLGTAGSIKRAIDRIPAEEFWITYGDSFVQADLLEAEKTLHNSNCSGIMTVYQNCDYLQPSNTDVANGIVTEYRKLSLDKTYRWIDFGLLYLNKHHFESVPTNRHTDLSAVFTPIIEKHELLAWEAEERFWDIGTPEALRETEIEFRRRFK